jgi:hypothetical protein
MQVTPAHSGALGFDTASPLTAAICQSMVTLGYEFAIRYVSHAQPEARDLSPAEVSTILTSGLALMAVAHPPLPGWAAVGVMGTEHATWAVNNLSALGIVPPGMTVWCDLEGVLPGTAASDIIAYVNAWTSIIKAAGYQPGLYVGYDNFLSGSQLYTDLFLTRYWKSASNVTSPAVRGFCMQQTIPAQPVAGISIDRNIIYRDRLQGLPTWLVA